MACLRRFLKSILLLSLSLSRSPSLSIYLSHKESHAQAEHVCVHACVSVCMCMSQWKLISNIFTDQFDNNISMSIFWYSCLGHFLKKFKSCYNEPHGPRWKNWIWNDRLFLMVYNVTRWNQKIFIIEWDLNYRQKMWYKNWTCRH